MVPVKTRETLEYEKASKATYELYLKSEISKEGIDTSKVPRKVLDDIKRLKDKGAQVNRKCQETIHKAQQEASVAITKAQQEANVAITKAQQEMQAEMAEIEKEGEAIINAIKIEQDLMPAPEALLVQPEPEKGHVEEEVEKGHEAGET